MRYQVKAAVPVAITPAGPVEYPKIGGFVEIPSRVHAAFLQSRGILVKDGEEIDDAPADDQVKDETSDETVNNPAKNLHKMTSDEIDELSDDEFEKLAGEDADMRRATDQSIEDFRGEVVQTVHMMAKMSAGSENENTEQDEITDPADDTANKDVSEESETVTEEKAEPVEKALDDMDKNELEAYTKKHFSIDIDKRKGLPKLLEQVKGLIQDASKGE